MSAASLPTTPHLGEPSRGDVLQLVAAATEADGSAPLSEQFLLDLRRESGARHTLRYAGPQLVGYAQLSAGAGELVVHPEHRRQGIGSALLASLPADVRVWAHGHLPAATAFAEARGLEPVRELYLLGRSLGEDAPLEEPVLPADLTVRAFEPGCDEDEWLRVNAAAFSHHPEQGRLTRADLDARMTESWFDSHGFLLVVPKEHPDTIAAFHWTKIHPAGKPAGAKPGRLGRAHELAGAKPGRLGEVYVLGVDPAYQGRGLARPLTLLGLHHLRKAGMPEVILYVDGDNPAALTVYRGLGFTTRGLDRMYSRAVHLTVER
jgi:mycothiol synthase